MGTKWIFYFAENRFSASRVGQQMSKMNSIVAFAIFVSLGFFGAWLVGLFETTNPSANVSGWELLLAFLGFLILVAALIGIVLLIRRNIQHGTEKDMAEWKSIRKQGKRRYFRAAIVKGVFLGLVFLLPLIAYYQKANSFGPSINRLWIYAALFLASVLASYFAALRTWNANERDYEAAVHSKPEQAYDLPGHE